MPSRISLAAGLPRFQSLDETTPNMPPIKDLSPIKTDGNGTVNTARAAGSVLIDSAMPDTSQLTGLVGQVDSLA